MGGDSYFGIPIIANPHLPDDIVAVLGKQITGKQITGMWIDELTDIDVGVSPLQITEDLAALAQAELEALPEYGVFK